MTKPNKSQYIKITREDIEGKFDLTEEALTRDSNKPQLSEEMEKQFREKFLMKGSDCTWKVYPDPEEVMAFQATAIEEEREENKRLRSALDMTKQTHAEQLARKDIEELDDNDKKLKELLGEYGDMDKSAVSMDQKLRAEEITNFTKDMIKQTLTPVMKEWIDYFNDLFFVSTEGKNDIRRQKIISSMFAVREEMKNDYCLIPREKTRERMKVYNKTPNRLLMNKHRYHLRVSKKMKNCELCNLLKDNL